MRKISIGLTGFAGALLLIASMGSAFARDHREGVTLQHDRGSAHRNAQQVSEHRDRHRGAKRKHKKQRAEYRERHDDRRDYKRKRRHHDRDYRRDHRRRDHRRDRRRHDRRHGGHRAGVDLGPVTLFFGSDHRRHGHGHKRYGHGHKRYGHGHKHRGHGHNGGHYQATLGCQEVSKVGWWNGSKAVIGGTGCYDRYGNFYVVPGSRYVIRYIY